MSRLVDLAYAAAWRAVRALPEPVAGALFRAGADAAARRRGKGTSRLAANLRMVVGESMPDDEFEALVRRAMRSYSRYWLEVFRLPSQSAEAIRTGFHLERGHLLGENVAAGRGSIVALPHAGNWDAAGAWVAAQGWPITAVVERLKPEAVYERFLDFRRSLGMHTVPHTGGDRAVMEALESAISKAHIIPLLADRDLSARGVEVEFFGGRTRMPAGPAILALRTGAPLYFVDMWYEPERPVGSMHGPIEVPTGGSFGDRARALTQTMADQFAAGIARHPQDWHMLQRMWTPGGRHSPDGPWLDT